MAQRTDNVAGNFFEPFIRNRLRLNPQIIAAGGAQAVIVATAGPAVFCDPGGAGIDLLLPAEAEGLAFVIFNTADAAEAIAVKEDSDTTTIITLDQNQAGLVVCDGTTWRGFIGGIT